MVKYLILHSILSLFIVLALFFFWKGPFKVAFWLCMVGMVQWLVPFEKIPVSQTFFSTYEAGQQMQWVQKPTIVLNQIEVLAQKGSSLPNINILVLFSCLGFILFTFKLGRSKALLKNMEASKYEQLSHTQGGKKIEVVILENGFDAFTYGIVNSKIYFGRDLFLSPHYHVALTHESQHIRNQDPLKILIMSFLTHLMWWNPFSYIFSRLGPSYIEYSCDQDCSQALGSNQYSSALAEILLEKSMWFVSKIPVVHMASNKKTFKTRMQMLSKPRKISHFQRVLLFLIPFSLIGSIYLTAGVEPDQNKKPNANTTFTETRFSGTLFETLNQVLVQQAGVTELFLDPALKEIKTEGEMTYTTIDDLLSQLSEAYNFRYKWSDDRKQFSATRSQDINSPGNLIRVQAPSIADDLIKVEIKSTSKQGVDTTTDEGFLILSTGTQVGFQSAGKTCFLELNLEIDMCTYSIWVSPSNEVPDTKLNWSKVSVPLGKKAIVRTGQKNAQGDIVMFEMEMVANRMPR